MSIWNKACDLLKSIDDEDEEVEKAGDYRKTGNPADVSPIQRGIGKMLGANVEKPDTKVSTSTPPSSVKEMRSASPFKPIPKR